MHSLSLLNKEKKLNYSVRCKLISSFVVYHNKKSHDIIKASDVKETQIVSVLLQFILFYFTIYFAIFMSSTKKVPTAVVNSCYTNEIKAWLEFRKALIESIKNVVNTQVKYQKLSIISTYIRFEFS